MSTTLHIDRRAELARLLQWALLPEGDREPFPGGRRSPLIEDEDDMPETAGILAARHPQFNGAGLGFDLPHTGDWPSVILVGPGGRATDATAIEIFFGLPAGLAARILTEMPSLALIAELVALDGSAACDGRLVLQ